MFSKILQKKKREWCQIEALPLELPAQRSFEKLEEFQSRGHDRSVCHKRVDSLKSLTYFNR